jgi:hypothetical protein
MSIAELMAVNRFMWLRWTVAGMSLAYVYLMGWLVCENRNRFLNTREYICVYLYPNYYKGLILQLYCF